MSEHSPSRGTYAPLCQALMAFVALWGLTRENQLLGSLTGLWVGDGTCGLLGWGPHSWLTVDWSLPYLSALPCRSHRTGSHMAAGIPQNEQGRSSQGGKWLCNLILGVLFYFFRHGYLFRNTFTWVWRPWSGLSAICSGRWLHSELVSWSSKIELLLSHTFTHSAFKPDSSSSRFWTADIWEENPPVVNM